MSFETIDSTWFAGIVCIGIVVIKNNAGEKKAYIGTGDGVDQAADERQIVDHGMPVSKTALEAILINLK